MWKTVLLLIFTLIIVPIIAFIFDEPLTGLQSEALIRVGTIYLVFSIACFVVSTLTKNYSQVDKLWSIMPIIYAWVISYTADFEPRTVLMAVLVTVWGVRLTFNFARRDGYHWRFWEGEEDYRWAILRAKPEFQGPGRWMAFNLFFISLYQMGLVLLITLPALQSIGGGEPGIVDYILALLFIALVVIETVADQQQWNYQNEKHRMIKAGERLSGKYEKGFVHTGLWGIVRHPNYAAEQALWIVFYFFSVAATGNWINWSVVGCLLLALLFRGSSDFSEAISSEKYPGYAKYREEVSRFVPLGSHREARRNSQSTRR